MPDYLQMFMDTMAQAARGSDAMVQGLRQNAQLAETTRANQAREQYEGRTADLAEKAENARQAQQDFTDAFVLQKAGATPVLGASGQGPVTNPMPAPVAVSPAGGGLMDSLAGGEGSYQAPALAPAAASKPGLMNSLGAAGGVAPAPAAPMNSGITVNHGGVTFALPSLTDEHRAAVLQATEDGAANRQAELELNGVGPTPQLVKDWGLDAGKKYLPDQLSLLAKISDSQAQAEERDAAAKKPAAKPELKFESVTNDAGDVVTTGRDPVTGAVVNREVQKGAGKSKEVAAGGAKPATKGELAKVVADKQKEMTGSQEQLTKELGAIPEAAANYAKAFPNAGKEGGPAPYDRLAAAKTAYTNHYQRLQQAQLGYEGSLSALTGHDVGHDDWADRAAAQSAAGVAPGAASAPPAPAAKPAAAPPAAARGPAAQKVATMADIDAATKANGMSRADTIKAFQAKGWKIGQ